MKRFYCAILLAALMLLSACGAPAAADTGADGAPNETAAGTAQSPEDAPQAPEGGTDISSAGKTIAPMASELDLTALDDCTFAASFGPGDAVVNDEGVLTLTLTVYDYERFDMVDISALEVGDILVIEGNTAPVNKLERDGNHVTINGGYDAGGYDLYTDEDGVYYESIEEYGKIYYEVGQVTLPVDQDFLLTDNSDPQNQGVTLYPGDLLNLEDFTQIAFTANATTVHTAGGKIVEITREYRP